jgi:hypothetical protein
MANSFADTTIEAAQANTLNAVKTQVADLNVKLKAGYLTSFDNWAQTVLAGRPANGDPPKPPNAFVVGYFNDPTTGPGSGGFYGDTVFQWAYPAVGKEPVCAMPPIPGVNTHPLGIGLIGVQMPGVPGWFTSLDGDTTPGGTVFPGTSKDGVSGLFQKVASPFGSNPSTGAVGGWYMKVA